MTIEQTWNNGGYLSGLKGVTIPNNTPSFNEDPRKGRHWSSDNAIQADDESLKGIFASLNSMPTVSQQDVQIPDPQPVSQSQPSEQSVAQQQTTQAIQQSQEAHVFPTTSDRQPVGTGSLQFDEDTDATQQNPAYEEHGPIQQIDSNPPSFVPGATPFAKRQTDIAETAAQQMPPTITHIPQDAAFQRPQPQQQQRTSRDFSVAIAEELENIQEHVDEVQIQVQRAEQNQQLYFVQRIVWRRAAIVAILPSCDHRLSVFHARQRFGSDSTMGEAVPVRFGQIGHEQFHVMVGHGVRIAFQGHVVAVKHQNGRFAAVCDSVDSRHRQSGVLQAENHRVMVVDGVEGGTVTAHGDPGQPDPLP